MVRERTVMFEGCNQRTLSFVKIVLLARPVVLAFPPERSYPLKGHPTPDDLAYAAIRHLRRLAKIDPGNGPPGNKQKRRKTRFLPDEIGLASSVSAVTIAAKNIPENRPWPVSDHALGCDNVNGVIPRDRFRHRAANDPHPPTIPTAAVKFEKVRLQAIAVTLPSEIVTSDDVEARLEPLYQRLKLPAGRLEGMSGIRQRRVWSQGTMPSGPSILSGNAVIAAAGIDPGRVGCLIHASVCRDFLEPATASKVHHGLGLSDRCWAYDVSNACLGMLNGAVQIATLIEAGAIAAGIVVATENSRPLLDQTIRVLNEDVTLTRQSVKPAFASLTIGSGSCAMLLTHRDESKTGPLRHQGSDFSAAAVAARTQFHDLCRSDQDTAGAGMTPVMDTDSEALLHEGIETGALAFDRFLHESGWDRESIDQTICHQVGGRHRAMMLDRLGLLPARDHVVFPWTGNTGSVALPVTLGDAAHRGLLSPGHRVALLGIGSGIHSVMLAIRWGDTAVTGNFPHELP